MNKISISILLKELEQALARHDGYLASAKGENPRTGYLDLSQTKVKRDWEITGKIYSQYNYGYSKAQKEKALYWNKYATRVWDHIGLINGIYELHTGYNISNINTVESQNWCSKLNYNIDNIPHEPGIMVLRFNPHINKITRVGIIWKQIDRYWYLIESKGVMHGVSQTCLQSNDWTHWGYLDNYFDYSIKEEKPYAAGALSAQKLLLQAGYKCTLNDLWDKETEEALYQFQLSQNLPIGSYNNITKNVLSTYVHDNKQIIKICNVTYIYDEPHIGAIALQQVLPNEQFDYAMEVHGKWIKVFYNNNKTGWINSQRAIICKT